MYCKVNIGYLVLVLLLYCLSFWNTFFMDMSMCMCVQYIDDRFSKLGYASETAYSMSPDVRINPPLLHKPLQH